MILQSKEEFIACSTWNLTYDCSHTACKEHTGKGYNERLNLKERNKVSLDNTHCKTNSK